VKAREILAALITVQDGHLADMEWLLDILDG
jgi:hypothetical protein